MGLLPESITAFRPVQCKALQGPSAASLKSIGKTGDLVGNARRISVAEDDTAVAETHVGEDKTKSALLVEDVALEIVKDTSALVGACRSDLEQLNDDTVGVIATRILNRMLRFEQRDESVLQAVIDVLFEAAQQDNVEERLVASISDELSQHLPLYVSQEENVSFRKAMLLKCKSEFDSLLETLDAMKAVTDANDARLVSMTSLIHLLAELYNIGMLSTRVPMYCIQRFLPDPAAPNETAVELLSRLFLTCGAKLDVDPAIRMTNRGQNPMSSWAKALDAVASLVHTRTRSLISQVLERRSHGWTAQTLQEDKNQNQTDKRPRVLRRDLVGDYRAARKETSYARDRYAVLGDAAEITYWTGLMEEASKPRQVEEHVEVVDWTTFDLTESLRRAMTKLVDEFIVSHEKEDAQLSFDEVELDNALFKQTALMLVAMQMMADKNEEAERTSIVSLITAFHALSLLSNDAAQEAFQRLVDDLDEITIDIPNAPSRLAPLVQCMVGLGLVSVEGIETESKAVSKLLAALE